MPVYLGGGERFAIAAPTTYHDVSILVVNYETDGSMLEKYVPEPPCVTSLRIPDAARPWGFFSLFGRSNPRFESCNREN